MTCIVGLEHDGGVTIGGDSAAAADDLVDVVTAPKVFRVGEYLIGYCESFRMGQLLAYRLRVPEQKYADDLEHLSTVFVDRVREVLHKGGVAKSTESEETNVGSFLLGYRGHLYSVESDYAVLRSVRGYQAVGCGADLAIGSIASTTGPAEKRVRFALGIAATHSGPVLPPFTVLTQTKETP